MNTKRMNLLDAALSETGIVPIFAADIPLADELSEIIGILHRELESRGMTADEIRDLVGRAQ